MVDIPKWHQFMRPLLLVLKESGEMYRHDAIEAVVKKERLTDEQLAILQESNGKCVAKERIGWASSYLRVAGALVGPKRGYFALGPNSTQLLNLERAITKSDLKGIPEYQNHQAKNARTRAQGLEDSDSDDLEDDTPQDLIDRGIKRLRSQLVDDLLEQIKSISPAAFENLILQVLAKMGYGGGDPRRIQGVPRGKDGGIDGTIDEDKLGLDQIYIQAKRYSDNSVGRPTIQSFVGAMSGGGCKKGVFVTSSVFTSEAKEFANGLKDVRLVLIDGVGLAKLMIEHCVGVQVKETIQVARLDQDFFNGED
ncbi:restriction endonuclease [Prochlorococcus sp. MIT 1223]|uniref:restriction endonuclease n=1 Tax=Prochlorococcus sp. MIT 1223 TaxID=3096217 RepID=UPI002A7591DD|nr:restriction endonuclease [Prochlorococcus sp. MIT 1223]